MHCQITHPFLRFSANPLLTEKKVRFFQEDRLVFSLNIPLTDREPTFFAYMDVRRFMGQTLTLSCEPEMAFEVVPCDEIPKEQDALRPQWHFTVQNGWTNDPNGMIYLDGVYHLFYQYNPCSTAWGNMHWGHATSTDLFHWTEQDTALFPDETGTMYSGGAVLDENNTSGLGTAEQPPVLLFYTAAGKEAVDGIPKPYAQYAAFSANRLQTVEKLPKPVLPHIEAENRDPKVVWCAELQRWVMSLFLDIGRYGLYTSENLLDWLPLQTLELEKNTACPDFFRMKATDGTPKWVFITAHDCYLIGHMTPQGFVAEQEMQRLNQPGGIYYAAQTFANMPNDRVIRMAWHILNAPAKHFSQQMSIPAELTLYRDANGYRLAMLPVRELDAQTVCALQASETVAGEKTWAILPTAADVRLKFAEDAELTVTLFGRTIAISAGQNTVTCEGRTVPLSVSGEEKNLRIICDRCSMELFADSGRICLAVRAIQDTSVPTLRLQTEQPQNIQIAVYHNR